jgi:tRNA(Ile)-lysidine synthase TilS/MesJ
MERARTSVEPSVKQLEHRQGIPHIPECCPRIRAFKRSLPRSELNELIDVDRDK